MKNLATAIATSGHLIEQNKQGLAVEDVFSTYTYTGTGAALDIVNGIDLSTEGGLVWCKARSSATNNSLWDTERLEGRLLKSNTADAQTDIRTDYPSYGTYGLQSFNVDGFTLGLNWEQENPTGADMVSWTFRKAPRFFDVVKYTGDGNTSKTVSHSLGATVGMMIVKRTDGVSSWQTYHKSLGATKVLVLEHTNAEETNSYRWNDTEPTTADFTVGASSNGNGYEYVAYLFADDPSGDSSDGLIACGSYTGNGSTDGPEIDLGWEAQHVTIKASDYAGQDWHIYDSMRGMTTIGAKHLRANTSAVEDTGVNISPRATGFKIEDNNDVVNRTGVTYIYMAIRRPMRTPESSDEVFNAIARAGTGAVDTKVTGVGFSPDLLLSKSKM